MVLIHVSKSFNKDDDVRLSDKLDNNLSFLSSPVSLSSTYSVIYKSQRLSGNDAFFKRFIMVHFQHINPL